MFKKLCYTTLLLLAAGLIASAADAPFMPQHFSARIGGFLGRTCQLDLREDTLIYTTYRPGHTIARQTRVKPTAAQWREFRQALDDLKVWHWRANYPNHDTYDGTQWALDIAYADHALTTNGNNNYPEANGKPNGQPELTKAFSRYLEAVEKLIGGKAF